jgi:hypothetical protein
LIPSPTALVHHQLEISAALEDHKRAIMMALPSVTPALLNAASL